MRITLSIVGVLLVLVGGIWVLQGINMLPGFHDGANSMAVYGCVAVAAVSFFCCGRTGDGWPADWKRVDVSFGKLLEQFLDFPTPRPSRSDWHGAFRACGNYNERDSGLRPDSLIQSRRGIRAPSLAANGKILTNKATRRLRGGRQPVHSIQSGGGATGSTPTVPSLPGKLYAAAWLDRVSVRGQPDGSVRVTKVGVWSSMRAY